MIYQEFIKELNIEQLTSKMIENWLRFYKIEVYELMPISKCGKWQKYLNHKEIPFPCCCSKKEEDCLFIELYYNLENLVKEEEPDLFYINNIIKRTLNNFKP